MLEASHAHCSGVRDLERMVARLHCASRGACARDAVVLYEDAARRRVGALVAALRGLQAVAAALGSFPQPPASAVLRALACGGAARSLAAPLEELAGAADWEAAKADGRIVPRPVRAGVRAHGQYCLPVQSAIILCRDRMHTAMACCVNDRVMLFGAWHGTEAPEGKSLAGRGCRF